MDFIPVTIKLEGGQPVIKRERGENEEESVPNFRGTSYDIFQAYPEIPIRQEHIETKRRRCICMEDSALIHISNTLKQVDATIGAICVTNISEFISRLRDEFKHEISISSEDFEDRLKTIYLEIEENQKNSSNSRKKKLGKAGQIQKLLSVLRQAKSIMKDLSKLTTTTRARQNQMIERQVVINNKLSQIRVKRSEGGVLQTTEWGNWSFLNEKQKKKKQKL